MTTESELPLSKLERERKSGNVAAAAISLVFLFLFFCFSSYVRIEVEETRRIGVGRVLCPSFLWLLFQRNGWIFCIYIEEVCDGYDERL